VAAQWAVGWWQLVVRYSFLLQELFAVLARQKIALKNKLLWFGVHPSRRYSTGAIKQIFGPRAEIKERRWKNMATYRDPVTCFAPLEIIERLLEIRVEAGHSPAIYLLSPDDLADYLDAYGFDVYALSEAEAEFHFGDYRAPLAPGGDHAHCSLTAH
jgi:hypothetical protein